MSNTTIARPGVGAAELRAALRAFIAPRFPGVDFGDGENIFALGFVNSLFAMELVLFIEKTTGAHIPNSELTLGNFCSIDAMTDLATRVRATQPEALP